MKKKKVKWLTVLWWIGLVLFILCFMIYWKRKDVVRSYNMANKEFRSGFYDLAESNYSLALYYQPTDKQQCSVRINKALAMVTPLTPESVTYDNLEDTIKILESAIDVLVADDCAHRDDDNGHSVKAQILKNEIDDYIEWLRENVKPPEEEKQEPQDQKEEPEQKQNPDEEDAQTKELREKIEQAQKEGMDERTGKLNQYSNYFYDYSYYDGKKW